MIGKVTKMGNYLYEKKLPKATVQSIIEKAKKTGKLQHLPGQDSEMTFKDREERQTSKKIKIN